MGERGITRRHLLSMAGVSAAAAMLPPGPQAVSATVSEVPRVAWVVGTPGEMDWHHIVARTPEEARRGWVSEYFGGDGCEVLEEITDAGGINAYLADGGELPSDPCDCDWCRNFAGSEAQRVPEWDGVHEGKTSNADWLKIGLGSLCSRCGYECSSVEGTGHAVAEEAVCEGCMTLADWRVVDPEHAAEIEAERQIYTTTHHGAADGT